MSRPTPAQGEADGLGTCFLGSPISTGSAMRIATWNLARKRPTTPSAVPGIRHLLTLEADIMVLTEARVEHLGANFHHAGGGVTGIPHLGEDERKVVIASRYSACQGGLPRRVSGDLALGLMLNQRPAFQEPISGDSGVCHNPLRTSLLIGFSGVPRCLLPSPGFGISYPFRSPV